MNAAEFIEKFNASTHFNEVLHLALVKITRESKITEELDKVDAEDIQTTDFEDKGEVNKYEYAILTPFEVLRSFHPKSTFLSKHVYTLYRMKCKWKSKPVMCLGEMTPLHQHQRD